MYFKVQNWKKYIKYVIKIIIMSWHWNQWKKIIIFEEWQRYIVIIMFNNM